MQRRLSLARGHGSNGFLPSGAHGSEAEHRLFERLFQDYNEIIRPVANVSDAVIIQFEVSMSQLVKVVSAGEAVAVAGGRGPVGEACPGPGCGLWPCTHPPSSTFPG